MPICAGCWGSLPWCKRWGRFCGQHLRGLDPPPCPGSSSEQTPRGHLGIAPTRRPRPYTPAERLCRCEAWEGWTEGHEGTGQKLNSSLWTLWFPFTKWLTAGKWISCLCALRPSFFPMKNRFPSKCSCFGLLPALNADGPEESPTLLSQLPRCDVRCLAGLNRTCLPPRDPRIHLQSQWGKRRAL